LSALKASLVQVPNRLTALIYYFELMGSFKGVGAFTLDQVTSAYNTVKRGIKWVLEMYITCSLTLDRITRPGLEGLGRFVDRNILGPIVLAIKWTFQSLWNFTRVATVLGILALIVFKVIPDATKA
jgi:hypothetical protein